MLRKPASAARAGANRSVMSTPREESIPAREVRGTDDAGLGPELRHAHVGRRAVASCGQVFSESPHRRLTKQLASYRDAAADNEHTRVEDRRQLGDTAPEPSSNFVEAL